jgi:hypothetical protein
MSYAVPPSGEHIDDTQEEANHDRGESDIEFRMAVGAEVSRRLDEQQRSIVAEGGSLWLYPRPRFDALVPRNRVRSPAHVGR